VKDRGSIAAGHLRKGEDESVQLSFSAKWAQLIGKSANSADPLQLYETLMFASGAGLTSTSSAGQQNTLTFEFTSSIPPGPRVKRSCSEGVPRIADDVGRGRYEPDCVFGTVVREGPDGQSRLEAV